MLQCTNCNTKLSCGCQKRLASDGKQVCSKCVTSYEDVIKAKKQLQQLPNSKKWKTI